MSKNWNVRRLLVCLLNGGLAGVLFLGSGCGFRPVIDTARFYVLNLDDYEADSEGDSASGSVVGMARLSVARYLDSPGIAVREGANRIMYSQSHRWAESLEYGVARLLVEALQREPAVKRVVAYPAR